MLSEGEAKVLAWGVINALPVRMRQQFKAVHIVPRLHSGMMTVRVFCVNQTAEDPEPFIFTLEDL